MSDSLILDVVPRGAGVALTDGAIERVRTEPGRGVTVTADIHGGGASVFGFLRVEGGASGEHLSVGWKGVTGAAWQNADGCRFVKAKNGGAHYVVMFPAQPALVTPGSAGRFSAGDDGRLSVQWQPAPACTLTVSREWPAAQVMVFPYWAVRVGADDEGRELDPTSELERRTYAKSDWFRLGQPFGLWRYLVDGSVYDPRVEPGIGKRFRCQQCAFALWGYLERLRARTQKPHYGFARDEIAFTVMADLDAEGKWPHGFYSERIEIHTRFAADGVALLLSQHEKTGRREYLAAADRGLRYLLKAMTDRLDDGSLWFLHDSLETASADHRFRSRLFGKDPGNALCLNTHVQLLTVLHRMMGTPGADGVYRESFEKGMAALRRVLNHRPGEFWYRTVVSGALRMRNGFERGGIAGVLANRMISRCYPAAYWAVRRRAPRLVHPSGLIERDLTLTDAPYGYLVINLKDLLVLLGQTRAEWLKPFIRGGVGFVRTLSFPGELAQNLYFMEWLDVLRLYDELVEAVPDEEMEAVAREIRRQTGAESLDADGVGR